MTAPTPTDLPTHPDRGWPVDPATGIVYGSGGRWAGLPIGHVGSHGYLVVSIRGKAYLLHRVMWEACVGRIPARMVINHINGNKLDNRLENLEVVTSSQNNRHAYAIGLKVHSVRGPLNGNYKVTPQMEDEILRRLGDGWTKVAVARHLGLSDSTVGRVARGVR